MDKKLYIKDLKHNFYILLKKLNKTVTFQNKLWFVLIALIGSIITIGTLFASINSISNNVKNINKDIEEIKYNYNSVYNQQVIDTSKLKGGEIIRKYFDYINGGDYQNACSLISTLQCTMFDIKGFTNWAEDKKRYITAKLRDGEKLLNIWDSGIKFENIKSEVWCGEIEYYMNTEDRVIKEIRQYYILDRPNGGREISKILCEKAMKNGEDRTMQICRSILENKYCTK